MASQLSPSSHATMQMEHWVQDEASRGLILVGLVAITDPLRPEIRDVISTLRDAGIRFFMVGSDMP